MQAVYVCSGQDRDKLLQLTFYTGKSFNEIKNKTGGIKELFNMGKNITTGDI